MGDHAGMTGGDVQAKATDANTHTVSASLSPMPMPWKSGSMTIRLMRRAVHPDRGSVAQNATGSSPGVQKRREAGLSEPLK